MNRQTLQEEIIENKQRKWIGSLSVLAGSLKNSHDWRLTTDHVKITMLFSIILQRTLIFIFGGNTRREDYELYIEAEATLTVRVGT